MATSVERDPITLQIMSNALYRSGIEFKEYEVNGYYDQMAAEYAGQCWETPAESGQARINFRSAVDSYLSGGSWEIGFARLNGATSFAAHLNGGQRCPQGSPYKRVGHLSMGFTAQRNKIVRSASLNDEQWRTNLRQLGIANDTGARTLENVLTGRLGRLLNDLKEVRLDNGSVRVLEDLLKLLITPERRYLGYRILTVPLADQGNSVLNLKLLGAMVLAADSDMDILDEIMGSTMKSPHEMFLLDQLVKRWIYSTSFIKPYLKRLINIIYSRSVGRTEMLLLGKAIFNAQVMDSTDSKIDERDEISPHDETELILALLGDQGELDQDKIRRDILENGLAATRELFRFYGAWLEPGGENKLYNPAGWPRIASGGGDSSSVDFPIAQEYSVAEYLVDLPDEDRGGNDNQGGASGTPSADSSSPAGNTPPVDGSMGTLPHMTRGALKVHARRVYYAPRTVRFKIANLGLVQRRLSNPVSSLYVQTRFQQHHLGGAW